MDARTIATAANNFALSAPVVTVSTWDVAIDKFAYLIAPYKTPKPARGWRACFVTTLKWQGQ